MWGEKKKSPRRLHQSVKALERKKKTDREEILVGRRFIPEPSFIVETIDRYLSTLPWNQVEKTKEKKRRATRENELRLHRRFWNASWLTAERETPWTLSSWRRHGKLWSASTRHQKAETEKIATMQLASMALKVQFLFFSSLWRTLAWMKTANGGQKFGNGHRRLCKNKRRLNRLLQLHLWSWI